MLTTNCYATLAELKAQLGISDTTDDAALKSALENTSRAIDNYIGRRFYVQTATRYFDYDPAYPDLRVDDLLAASFLYTDEDGDRTYEATWTASDFDLEPVNAPSESPPRPYTSLQITPDGDYAFPAYRRGIKIVGSWGYYQVLESLDTLAAAITSLTATTLTATSGALWSPGQTVLIDSEQMHVRSISTNTITVARGVNGTTAATHLNAAAVSVYTYPVVNGATLIQAARLFKRKDSPLGLAGSPELGLLTALPKLDSDVEFMLAILRRLYE